MADKIVTVNPQPSIAYRHKASGNLYELVAIGNDCTNALNRLVPVAIYRNAHGWWVRELKEFEEKFERIG